MCSLKGHLVDDLIVHKLRDYEVFNRENYSDIGLSKQKVFIG